MQGACLKISSLLMSLAFRSKDWMGLARNKWGRTSITVFWQLIMKWSHAQGKKGTMNRGKPQNWLHWQERAAITVTPVRLTVFNHMRQYWYCNSLLNSGHFFSWKEHGYGTSEKMLLRQGGVASAMLEEFGGWVSRQIVPLQLLEHSWSSDLMLLKLHLKGSDYVLFPLES